MIHVFSENFIGDKVRIEGEDVKHLRNVLRVEEGTDILVSDGYGRDVVASISVIEKDFIEACIIREKAINEIPELPLKIRLFQGLPKADKMELIIQKCVELGVSEIVPIETTRCVVKLDGKNATKKVERWQKIARSASEQCQRSIIPNISPVLSYKEAIKRSKPQNRVESIICYEQESAAGTLKGLLEAARELQIDELNVFIGPEGGFSEEEVKYAIDNGLKSVSLGKRILRTETAGMALIGAIMLLVESRCE